MPTHPFYVPQKGWTEAVYLRAGDILVTCNGEYVVVEQVQHEILETPVTVYNFEVEDFHTHYVAADADVEFVPVHNRCGQELPQSPKKVNETYIKQNGIDAHRFKRDAGVRTNQSRLDIFQDTKAGGRLWLGNKAQTDRRITNYCFKDLKNGRRDIKDERFGY